MTRLLRYYGCSDSCRSGPFQRTATASDRSLCFMHITFGPFRLQPPDAFQGRFCTLPLISLDFPCGSGLHPSIPGSPPHPAESSSPGPLSHCPHDGLVVHLGLLSTLPRGNAVISSYGPENVCPTGTCTLLIVCTHRRTTAGVSPAVDPRSRWYSIANGCSGDRYRLECHYFWLHPFHFSRVALARALTLQNLAPAPKYGRTHMNGYPLPGLTHGGGPNILAQ